MPPLRILLACPLMAKIDLWKIILDQDPEVELVGEADGPVDALVKAGDAQADVVVIDLPSSGNDPGLYSHLLEENPRLKVIAISQDGSRAIKYERGILRRHLGETSPETLKELFQSSWMDQDPVLSDYP